jgi:hypothetical protein
MALTLAGLFALVGLGCGGPAVVEKEGSLSPQHLRAISEAYLRANKKLGRPPQNLNEILPYLQKGGDPATFLHSPEDGEEYQIFWNIDVMSMRPRADGKLPVLAFEKHGKDGKRYVLEGHYIRQLNDEDFHKAWFPPGFTPPS